MTYRERRLRKAERLRGWADKREADAAATFERDRHYTEDNAFNTQPGHIPERARVIAREDRAFESLRKAENMQRRADGIEHAAEHAIYSDDNDAIERLRERVAELEAARARIKAYNAACRKAGDSPGPLDGKRLMLLDANQRESLIGTARVAPYSLGKGGAAPSYWGANLSGNISRQRKRLADLERRSQD